MSDGIRDAFRWSKVTDTSSGEGEDAYTVLPDDFRWSNRICWDDGDDEELVPLDNFGQPIVPYKPSYPGWMPWQVKECECGSAKTSNPNLHLRFCPKFTDPMGKS